MQPFKTEATLDADGKLSLSDLPFHAGDRVEITVSPAPAPRTGDPFPLRGMIIRFDNPTEPVAAEDWEAIQ